MLGCLSCGGQATETDPASGTTYCINCGNVLEENAIVAEIQFGETANGAAIVQGSYVASNSTGARTFGPRGRQPMESREQTLANAKRKITSLANALGVGDAISDKANRLFLLATTNRFVQGRRTEYVVASCLYVAARMASSTLMLIDFSDFLHINVFVLGATYLKLVKELNLSSQIPVVDPSIYISRFAQLLEFGDETHRVGLDATRLVRRFNKDWMVLGRRPAGICGAALLLAARMNNFRRTVSEIVQVVKIADVTVKKRLEEFKQTATGSLSLNDFRNSWIEESEDPPAFTQGKKESSRVKFQEEDLLEPVQEEEEEDKQVDPNALPSVKRNAKKKQKTPENEENRAALDSFEREVIEPAIEAEIQAGLNSSDGKMLAAECDELDRQRQIQAEESAYALEGLDEDELDYFILSPDEVALKERMWMEMNKDYLAMLADRHKALEGDEPGSIKRPKPRKRKKARDSTTAHAETAAEAARQLISKKKISKKINYDVLQTLFDHSDVPDSTAGNSGRRASGKGRADVLDSDDEEETPRKRRKEHSVDEQDEDEQDDVAPLHHPAAEEEDDVLTVQISAEEQERLRKQREADASKEPDQDHADSEAEDDVDDTYVDGDDAFQHADDAIDLDADL